MATAKREIPIDKDLMYQAQRKFPGYDAQAALTLYIIDQWKEQEKLDSKQNQLINAQKSDNEKLKRSLQSIGQELHDHERQAAETDREVERLKQLSAKLKPEAELRQQATKVSSDELQKIEKELELIKNKPGIDDDKYKKLMSQVDTLKSSNVASDNDVKNIENALGLLAKQKTVDDDLFNKVFNQLNDTKESLDAKERRFKSYIDRTSDKISDVKKSSAEELSKYQGAIDKLKAEIAPLVKEKDIVSNLRGEIQQMADEFDNILRYARKSINLPGQETKPSLPVSPKDQSQDAIALAKHSARQSTKPTLPVPDQGENILAKKSEQMNEDIRPAGHYPNPVYQEWLEENLENMVKYFKYKFRVELKNKDNVYPDGQIAYTIESHSPWLWQGVTEENPNISEEDYNTFMNIVKRDLFSQAPELDLSENSIKSHLRMFNQILK
jgi:DNA repair exonuclease SbcCD ATPase subunit